MREGVPREIAETLPHLPERPGVYLYRDREGHVIYVGKASSLRDRVRSYWNASSSLEPRKRRLLEEAATVETIVTHDPLEALILEANLIKLHRPRYNVRLRDDKQYPWLRIDLQEEWPRLELVRKRSDDGARYFGPYADAGALKAVLPTIRQAFPYRSCSDRRLRQGPPPCLYYHIGRCSAPCAGYVSREDYHAMVRGLVQFLSGQDDALVKDLRRQMEAKAAELKFEEAARLRDRLRSLERIRSEQKAVLRSTAHRDVVAVAAEEDLAAACVFFVRQGEVEGQETFLLSVGAESEEQAILRSFLQQYYGEGSTVPREILCPVDLEEREELEAFLSRLRGSKVHLRHPRRGEARRLVELVQENARVRLLQEKWRRDRSRQKGEEAASQLQEVLDLPAPPGRIECFDISHTGGNQAVGAMTVWQEGTLAPSQYRRFRIQGPITPGDDPAAMREVLHRRFRRALESREGHLPPGEGEGWARLPDLLLLDGGEGQLSAGLEVLRGLGLSIPIAALSEEREALHLPGRSPLLLPREAPALHLLQQLRDEAHRFGLGYHQKLRSKKAFHSLLDEIPGIGPKRKRALIHQFGSVRALVEAGPEALEALPGFPRSLAEKVYRYLVEEVSEEM
ncbi:MAG: excinuclease ABC subunit UvrC [Bacillota bacterium]|nr:excinuclease ABC subunit UvrC [Bacillota bacterium]